MAICTSSVMGYIRNQSTIQDSSVISKAKKQTILYIYEYSTTSTRTEEEWLTF